MDLHGLKELLERVKRGELSVADAAQRLAELPVQRIADFAQLDGDRALRQGAPEVIFGERKTPEQIAKELDADPEDVFHILRHLSANATR